MGKTLVGAMILAAAFCTARYLHTGAEHTPPTIVPKPRPSSRLNWLSSSMGPADALRQEVGTNGQEVLANLNYTRLTSTTEGIAPPSPLDSASSVSLPRDGQIIQATNVERTLGPFSLKDATASGGAGGGGTLVAVDDEELDPASAAKEFVQHTVQFGETLPQIAQQYMGRREAYMSIYQANLDVLDNPAELTPGTVLKIPVR